MSTLEHISFAVFPWIGVALAVVFFLTVAALSGACMWVRHTSISLAMNRHDVWNLVFRGICVAFLAGFVGIGLPSLAAVWVIFPIALVAFTWGRDALVADSRKYFSPKGISNIVGDLKAAWRLARGPREETKKLSLREQVTAMVAKVQAAASQGRMKVEVVKDAPPDLFAFVRKDGTIAMQMTAEGLNPDDGSPVSENVCNARDIMLTAIRQEATDLHFEPHEKEYFVRVRVDGVLRDVERMKSDMSRGVISAIKVFSDMDIAERRRPQDGTFAMRFGQSKYDVRVASTPTSYGEKLVMRILSGSGGVVSAGLDAVGLRVPVLKSLRDIIHKPYGMFLVVGPTGSGKTTTVYASLNEIDAHQHNITTIEDPVEYRLENITQIAVNTKAEVSFASILRSVLRQDPDVLLVGEIRDKETAEIACQAALTGHFVFSTLHANDSVATITRLLDLGLEPTLIQTAITAVLGQRLARRLCPKCKEPCQPPEGLVKKFRLKPGQIKHIYREKGCEHCKGTGYKGRMGIHELLVMNDGIRALVRPSPSITDLKKAATASGTVTLQTDGLMKVIQGDTSVNEILRVSTD